MKKNLLFLTLGIIAGVAIMYFLSRQSATFFEPRQDLTKQWVRLPDTDGNTGPGMLASYSEESKRLWYPLRADKDSILRGFWIDGELIKAINAGDPNNTVNGYRIYLGKRVASKKRHYSLVIRGTRPATTPDSKRDPRGNEEVGDYFDFVDPCPDNCGEN